MKILFFIFTFPLIYTYLIYPLFVNFLHYLSKDSKLLNQNSIIWPMVSVIMPVHNEEMVIEKKIQSLLKIDYPSNKILFFVGSDNSTDNTNSIINHFADQKKLKFFPYKERVGKSEMINKIFNEVIKVNPISDQHILIFTDANVIPEKLCFKELIKSISPKDVGLVDSRMVPISSKEPGISEAEKAYINYEVKLKHKEGQLWGLLMGPFGGCYAIKSNLFKTIPPNFCVDDFFISMNVMLKKYKSVSSLDAICYENVSKDLKEEFLRKKRISIGNFQNLSHFKTLWWPPQQGLLSFVFISHKLLRWVGPFFLLGASFTGFLIWPLVVVIFALLIFSENILTHFKLHIPLIRKIHYFAAMNFGVLIGFINYLMGTQNNVWEPPKRI